ncbi:hypothetical protein F4560_008339 [Saccharothrix ecbatanensis]|jgi:hypothetical protein|uniref:Uncharacterized protein n=1 Tax=Saccharothrix ecbatanensis TaxID=1105145 RepID=A0A7W9M5V2_9PSEU|nr:hypothetical protein [Saccharothrix ecbatanensis]MBB5808571.1 hypothetical protein [Saccharothrix ecbatanensis]
MPTMRNEPPHDGQPTSRAARRGARSSGAVQPRYGGGRAVVNQRQYAMRRR